jgi:hypothetical protein
MNMEHRLGKAKVLGEKPVPLPLCPPKTPWTDFCSKSGPCFEWLVINCLCHGTVILVTNSLKYVLKAIKLPNDLTLQAAPKKMSKT